jgi:hypothetical protein
MPDIYQHIRMAPDRKLGSIDPGSGHVKYDRFGPDEVLGRVDYDRGNVYRRRFGPDEHVGRVTANGKVYAPRLGMDRYLGRVKADGRVFKHRRFAPDVYLGSVRDMTHVVEGAAALLLVFLPMDEEDEQA